MSASCLETVHLHLRAVHAKTLFLVGKEFLYILALISLELDDLAHVRIVHDGAIASELLLDDLEDLLLVELLRQTLDSGQGFATVALWGIGQRLRRRAGS